MPKIQSFFFQLVDIKTMWIHINFINFFIFQLEATKKERISERLLFFSMFHAKWSFVVSKDAKDSIFLLFFYNLT